MICRRATFIVVDAASRVRVARIVRQGAVFVRTDKRCVMVFARHWIRIRIIVGRVVDLVGMMMRAGMAIARLDVIHRRNIAMVRVWM
jgi:hypothetical protein